MDVTDTAFGRSSVLGRTNAAVKILVACVLTLVFILSLDWVTSTLGLVLLLIAMTAAGLKPWAVARRLWFILVAAVLSGWATALMAEKSGEVVVEAGPLLLTTGSIDSGVAIMLRGCALALTSVIFLTTTDAQELGESLAQTFRLPARFVLSAVAAFRLMGLLAAEWQSLAAARRARGVGTASGLVAATTGFAQQAFALMVQALRRASRLAVTMEARGFGAGPRTWLNPPVYGRVDVVVLVCGLLIPAAAAGASLLLGTYRTIF